MYVVIPVGDMFLVTGMLNCVEMKPLRQKRSPRVLNMPVTTEHVHIYIYTGGNNPLDYLTLYIHYIEMYCQVYL